MWTENTYGAVRVNTMDDSLDGMVKPLTFYQKVWIMLVCTCVIVLLIQNRKNMSLELIFLVTIFLRRFFIPYTMGSKIKIYSSIYNRANTACYYKNKQNTKKVLTKV